jgi:ABC-type sugar transport system substrate-binding protein
MIKVKNKLYILLATIVVVLLSTTILVACAPKNVGVGIYIDNYNDGFRGPVGIHLQELFGDKANKRNAEGSQDNQINQINNDSNNGLTGIVASLPSPDSTLQIFERAKAIGVPIVTFSSEPSKLEHLESYDKGYLVSSNSKEAGWINSKILERGLFGLEEGLYINNKYEGLHATDIDAQFVKEQVMLGNLYNRIKDYSKTNTVNSDEVPVLKTLLVEGDTNNWGSTDRTRSAITGVNIFYETIATAEQELIDNQDAEYIQYLEEKNSGNQIFPMVATSEVKQGDTVVPNGLIFSGADGSTGFFSYFDSQHKGTGDPRIIKYAMTGVLQYHATVASNLNSGAAWSDSGARAATLEYLNNNAVPDIIIGASDQVTTGAVQALGEKGYNKAGEKDKTKVVPIVSTDGSEYGDALLKGGQMWGTADQSAKLMAQYVHTMMTNLLDGKDPLEGTEWVFDDTLNTNSSGTDGDTEHRVLNKIIRLPYTEYKHNN